VLIVSRSEHTDTLCRGKAGVFVVKTIRIVTAFFFFFSEIAMAVVIVVLKLLLYCYNVWWLGGWLELTFSKPETC
jgi:hypothetical protein